MGIGTLGSLGGGIADMAGAADRKRRFLEDEKRKAQVLQARNLRWGRFKGFFPTNGMDALYRAQDVRRQADEDPSFNPNPLSLVPFVGNATALAGGIYDYAKSGAQEDYKPTGDLQLTKPEQLTYRDPVQAARDEAPRAWEGGDLRYSDPERETPWWMRD